MTKQFKTHVVRTSESGRRYVEMSEVIEQELERIAKQSKPTDELTTPQAFFDELAKEFNFVLDVAATEENRKCEFYCDKSSDGLRQPWAVLLRPINGWFFCNPPYSNLYEWVKKCVIEMNLGAQGVALLPNDSSTKWFHDFIWDSERSQPRPGIEIRYPKRRLKFSGIMIVIFRGD